MNPFWKAVAHKTGRDGQKESADALVCPHFIYLQPTYKARFISLSL